MAFVYSGLLVIFYPMSLLDNGNKIMKRLLCFEKTACKIEEGKKLLLEMCPERLKKEKKNNSLKSKESLTSQTRKRKYLSIMENGIQRKIKGLHTVNYVDEDRRI